MANFRTIARKITDPVNEGLGKLDLSRIGKQKKVTGDVEDTAKANAQQAQTYDAMAQQMMQRRGTPISAPQPQLVDRSRVGSVSGPGLVQATSPQGQRLQDTPRTQLDMTMAAQIREQQQALAQSLQARAAGQGGPGAAEVALAQQRDRAVAQQQAQAQAARGGPGAMIAGQRTAQQQGALINQDIGAQIAAQRGEDQRVAQTLGAQVFGQMREQDINAAIAQGNLTSEEGRLYQNLLAQQYAQELAAKTEITTANLQAQVAQMDQSLRAQLANQGVDLEVLKTNAAAGNAMALANLDAALKQMGMTDDMIRTYLQAALTSRGYQVQGLGTAATVAGGQQAAYADTQAKVAGGLLQGAGVVGGAFAGRPAPKTT